MIFKTVAYVSRGTILDIFWSKTTYSFRSLNGNIGFPAGIFSSGLQKAHFRCSVQHFEKKMIKVNFTFCRLFRTVCVFICSDRKGSQGFQNHKLSVLRKNLGRIFLTQVLFQNIFLILSGKTWSFSGKLTAWLSNLDFMGTTEQFQSNVFEASL